MRIQQKWLVGLTLALVVALFVAGVALAAGETLPRFNLGGGGETVSTEETVLRGAFGQPVAGAVSASSTGSQLCGGFECGLGVQPQSTPEETAQPTPDSTSEPGPQPTPQPGIQQIYIPFADR